MIKDVIIIISRECPIKYRDKLIESIIPNNYTVKNIVWNTSIKKKDDSLNVYVFNYYIPGFRSLKFLKSIKNYVEFIDQKIIEEKPTKIFISHYTLYLPFLIFSKSNFEKSNILLDVHDLPSFRYNLISRIILLFEKYLLRDINKIVVASKYFENFYKKKQVFLLDNLPPFKPLSNGKIKEKKSKSLKIGFVGALRYPDIYKLLIKAISNVDHELHFFGSGSADYKLVCYAKEIKATNVFFHGKFEKKEIFQIYSSIDLSWACYPSRNFNVIHATSNKFLESIYFKVPAVFSSGTLLAEDVINQGIGFKLNSENYHDILGFLKQLNSNIINEKIKALNKIEPNDLELIKAKFSNFLKKV